MIWNRRRRERSRTERIVKSDQLYLNALDLAEACSTVAHWGIVHKLVARCVELEVALEESEKTREWLGEELHLTIKEVAHLQAIIKGDE